MQILQQLVASLTALAMILSGQLANLNKSSQLSAIVATSGLMGQWNFDENSGTTVSDTSANGRNGVLVNGVSWTTGKINSALNFDGSSGYVTLPTFIAPTSVTLEAWIYPQSNSTDSIIINKGNVEFDLRLFSDGSLGGSAGNAFFYDPTFNFFAPANVGQWYHVALTYDGGTKTLKLYRNAVQVGSNVGTVGIAESGLSMWIGRHAQLNFGSFAGKIDNVRIYDRPLSSSEILNNYNEGSLVTSPSTPPPTPGSTPAPTPVLPPLLAPIATPPPIVGNGVGNGITISDNSGSGQAGRPITISRIFVKGEFPAGTYPQARLNGSTLLTTQDDVKSTWSDGSLKQVLVSFATSIPTNGSIAIDFIKQNTPNNTSYLDKPGMLNYGGGSWDATINTSLGNVSARTMLNSLPWASTDSSGSQVRYWMKGPIATQVIVEDKSTALSYDFGSNSYKSLHPAFVLTFYPGTSLGVKAEYIVENDWTTKLQDQSYSLNLTANGSNVYSKGTFTHAANTRWHKVYWAGTKPSGWIDAGHPGINVNYNLAYMAASGAIPNFDPSITTASSAINNDISAFNASDKGDIMGHGLWTQYMPQAGGRDDIGVIPQWYARYLFSFDPGEYAVLLGQAEAGASVPAHFRESATGKFFDSAKTVDAFGRVLSIDARPTTYTKNLSYLALDPGDQITAVGPRSTNGWDYDTAHLGAFEYIPAIITGDWFYVEEMQMFASMNLASVVQDINQWSRHNSWGYFNDTDQQTRGVAWGRRDIGDAGFVSPDGSPEKAYFTEKVNNNIAVEEGVMNITTGSFYQPCTTNPYDVQTEKSKWCWGRNTVGWNFTGSSNPLYISATGNNNNLCNYKTVCSPDPYAPASQDAFYQHAYKFNTMGHWQDQGYPTINLNNKLFVFLIHILGDQANFNPWLVNSDSIATIRAAPLQMYQTAGDLLKSFMTNYNGNVNLRTVTGWWDSASDDRVGDGYPHIWQAAASYATNLSDGSASGNTAWNWTVAKVSRVGLSSNPQYAVLPRSGSFPTSAPVPPPLPTPPSTPVPSPSPTPVPPPSPIVPSLSTKFVTGQRVQTTASLGVRAIASVSGTLLGTESIGSLGTIISGGTSADGFFWWNVNYDSGINGYSAEDFLQTYIEPTPLPPPTQTPVSPPISAPSSPITPPVNKHSIDRFLIGDRVRTISNLKVRLTPTIKKRNLCVQPQNAYGTVTAGPIIANNYTWWQIDYDSHCDGWSVQDWLTK